MCIEICGLCVPDDEDGSREASAYDRLAIVPAMALGLASTQTLVLGPTQVLPCSIDFQGHVVILVCLFLL